MSEKPLSKRTGDDVLQWDKQGHYWYTENGEEWSPNEMLVYATQFESQIEAMRDFMALLYLGIREGRDEAFEKLDEKTRHLINEVWFERLEEDEQEGIN